jgi:hypothetical protein
MYMYVYDKYMNPVHNGLAEYHIHSDLDILPEQSVVEPWGGGKGGNFHGLSDQGGAGQTKSTSE